MTEPLNLDPIRRRTEAATEGPWIAGWRSLPSDQIMLSPKLPPVELSCDVQGRKNAKFIAAARTDVPALLAEVDRLRFQVADLKAKLRDEGLAHSQTIDERDNAQEWADKLAAAIAPGEIRGEHSSSNNPWANALDYAEQL